MVWYKLVFDFIAIDSWDGTDTSFGQDRFLVVINNTNVIFNETFANQHPGQTFPRGGVVPQNLGFGASYDSIYRDITVLFSTPVGTAINANFRDGGLQGMADESWGIDNVRLYSTVPAPGALSLCGAAAILGTRRRR